MAQRRVPATLVVVASSDASGDRCSTNNGRETSDVPTTICSSRIQLSANYYYVGEAKKQLAVGGVSGCVPHGTGVMTYESSADDNGACDQNEDAPIASRNNASSSEASSSPSSPSHGAAEQFIAKYSGTFRDGKRHGRGSVETRCGVKLTCNWIDNVPQVDKDVCLLTTEDRNTYVGLVSIISDGTLTSREGFDGLQWVSGVRFVPDATGEMVFRADRKRYCGEWQCGQRHGFGVETDIGNSYYFSGGFQYDAREGSGTVFQVAQRTVLSGLWKDGKLHGSAGLHLPNHSAIVQSHSWVDIDHYEYDSATILRSRVVDGIWEPLFVNFDNTLALSVAGCLSGGTRTSQATPWTKEPDSMSRLTIVLESLEDILRKDDFQSLLTTFQRCFYFMYGSCQRFQEYASGGMPKSPKTRDPPSTASMRTGGVPPQDQRTGPSETEDGVPVHRLFPESWCCLSGLSAKECIHAIVRERTYCAATLKQAVMYVASFVFSVRLRLLSYLAALPTACDMSVGRTIATLCWDSAFSAVEPLLLHMASSLTKSNFAAIKLAAMRCEGLTLAAFIGPLELWFGEAENEGEAVNGAATPDRTSPLSTPPVHPPLTRFMDHIRAAQAKLDSCGILDPPPPQPSSSAPGVGINVVLRSTSTGRLICVARSEKVSLSSIVDDVQAVMSEVREASRVASRAAAMPAAFAYLQEQLLGFLLLKRRMSTNLEGMVSMVSLMMSDAIDPPLPGAVMMSPAPLSSVSCDDSGIDDGLDFANDSMDGHRMLSGGGVGHVTDHERQAALHSTYQMYVVVTVLHRSASVWPSLCVPRWGCVLPLEELLLRMQHGIVISLVKNPTFSSDEAVGNAFDDDEEMETLRILPLKCCRDLNRELATSHAHPELDVPPPTHDLILWLIEAVPLLVQKLREAQQKRRGVGASKDERGPQAAVLAKKSVKQRLEESHWYREIIPRFAIISNLVGLLGLKLSMGFVSSTGHSPVAPREAVHVVLTLGFPQQPQALARETSFMFYVLGMCMDQWERAACQVLGDIRRKLNSSSAAQRHSAGM